MYQEVDIEGLLDEREWISIGTAGFDQDLGALVGQGGKLADVYYHRRVDSSVESGVREVLRYVYENTQRWVGVLPTQYQDTFRLLLGSTEFEDDIVSLLGFGTPQTYLVVLQNTAESRPNGGFFGSFAVVKIVDGQIASLEIVDSYVIDRESPTVIQGPEWLLQYLPHRDIHFVGANKTGFTYHDGDGIKTLYENAYPGRYIRGVVFLRTDMFASLIPDFDEIMWERQFTNAANELIRGVDRWGKKEQYLTEVSALLDSNKIHLMKQLLLQLPDLVRRRLINMYLVDISVSGGSQGRGLSGWLRDNQLTTRFEDDTLYARDANTSYNKIDEFVEKQITIRDSESQTYYAGGEDIIDISDLETGVWEIDISYILDVPDEHYARINTYEQKYGISLTDRERHILGLTPIWENRGLIHLSDQREIVSITGDIQSGRDFDTPIPTNVAGYMVELEGEGSVEVTIKVEKKKGNL